MMTLGLFPASANGGTLRGNRWASAFLEGTLPGNKWYFVDFLLHEDATMFAVDYYCRDRSVLSFQGPSDIGVLLSAVPIHISESRSPFCTALSSHCSALSPSAVCSGGYARIYLSGLVVRCFYSMTATCSVVSVRLIIDHLCVSPYSG